MTHEIAASRPVYLSTNSINYHVTPASLGVGGSFAGGQDRPGTPEATASRKVAAGLSAAPGRAEQAGDLGYGRVARFDVAHGRARGFVPGLGHDQLERDLLAAEVDRRGVAKLVQFQAVAGGETGLRAATNSGPLVREVPSGRRSSRGSRCAVRVSQ